MPFLKEFERLFQLEFFVNFVEIQNRALITLESTVCVSFQFLHYPVMRVCEEDFSPKSRPVAEDSRIVFKAGKSCLFSVHSDDKHKIPAQFNLVISVCQSVWCTNERQLIGTATVSLGSSFLNLLTPPPNMSTPANSIKHDAFPLKDSEGKTIGRVAAYASVTCYGKLIVTECQMGAEDELNFMFKGVDPKKIFKNQCLDFPNIEYGEDDEMELDTPYEDIFGYPKESEDELQQIELSEEEEEEEEEEEGEMQDIDICASGAGLGSQISGVDKSQEDESYKEIGAEVNGHIIKIRVLKKRKRPVKSEEPEPPKMSICCCPPEPPICPNAPKLNVCDCDFPLPPELIPRCPPQCFPSPCPPPQCCPPPCTPPCPPPQCCQLPCPPAPCPPPECACCPLPKISKQKRLSSSKNGKIGEGSKEDCGANFNESTLTQLNPMSADAGTVVMKGDDVFYQSLSKKGEPLKDQEKEIAKSLYYKSNCCGASKNPPC